MRAGVCTTSPSRTGIELAVNLHLPVSAREVVHLLGVFVVVVVAVSAALHQVQREAGQPGHAGLLGWETGGILVAEDAPDDGALVPDGRRAVPPVADRGLAAAGAAGGAQNKMLYPVVAVVESWCLLPGGTCTVSPSRTG